MLRIKAEEASYGPCMAADMKEDSRGMILADNGSRLAGWANAMGGWVDRALSRLGNIDIREYGRRAWT